ncbi:MAG TPA: flippase-like domain-containing protein [Methylomirabilota bacterium]|nr:flippase-like domain-containing protein [Methylomirabilota bacterium]
MTLLRVLAAAAGLAVIGWLWWDIGPDVLVAQVRALSWRLPVVFLPYTLIALLDAIGWYYNFLGRRPSVPLLMAVRLAGEAVNLTTPTATLGGEPVKAWLLTRAGVPLEEGLLSVVIAKTALVVSHIGFLVVGLTLAFWLVPPTPGLRTFMVVLTGVGVAAIGGFVWAQQRGLFGASGRALAWFGIGDRIAGHLFRLDEHVTDFYRNHRGRFALCVFWHFLGWVAGGFEVWVILRLLDVPVSFATALVIEAFATAIRSATFMIPASLGAQEGGFVGIFVGFGLGAGAGFAFGVVRRLREVLWAAVGFAFLAAWRGDLDAAMRRGS